MKTKPAVKKFTSLLASIGLLSGLALTSGASPVSAAIEYPDVQISLERDASAASVEILDGQTVEFLITANIAQEWSGWDSNPTTFSVSAFSLGSLPSGVTLSKTEYYWSATNTTDPGANCNQNQMKTTDPSKATFTLTVACKNDINRVFAEVTYTLTNSSGTPQTVDSNAESAEMTSGGSAVPESDVNTWAYAIETMTAGGILMPSNTGTGIELEFGTLCVATDVANGTEVTIVRDVTLDNTETIGFWNITDAMPSVYLSDYTYSFRDGDDADNLPEDTFVVDAMNRTFYGNMRLSIQDDTIEGKNLKFSLDLTVGGVSKLSSSCGGGGGMDTFPTLGSLSGGAAAGKGKLSAPRALPVGALSGVNGLNTTAGPNGDIFNWGSVGGPATVTRLGPTGNLKINGVNVLTQNIGVSERVYSFGWYGAKSDKYVMVVGPGMLETTSAFKIYFGNLDKTGGKSNATLPANQVHGASGICGVADMPGSPFVISAPTANPVISIRCGSMMGGPATLRYNVFGALTSNGTKITSFGVAKPSGDKVCGYAAVGVNNAAKGKVTAVLIYSALGKKTATEFGPEPECMGKQGSDRSFVTVSASGTAKKEALTSGFGATESMWTRIGPGKAANTWIVMTHDAWDAPPTPSKAYTVSSKLKVAPINKTVQLPAEGGFAAIDPEASMENSIAPIGVLKNNQWLVIRTQFAYGMSPTYRIAIAKFDPKTGRVTSGESLSLGGYSYGGKYINGIGISNKKVLSFYALTEAGKYKVATWKSYIS